MRPFFRSTVDSISVIVHIECLWPFQYAPKKKTDTRKTEKKLYMDDVLLESRQIKAFDIIYRYQINIHCVYVEFMNLIQNVICSIR